jgi:membrane protein YdbS with pleckstrin-like domain
MRLVPQEDTVPASVNRYLLPRERQVITVRMHPAVLLGPLILVVGGLAAAMMVRTASAVRPAIVWGAWALILLYFLRQVAAWAVTYFTVTNERMITIRGVLIRKVSTMPLGRATDLSFRRSIMGRLFGYGTLIAETSGRRQPFRYVRYVPYPEQLYLEIFELMLPHGAPTTVCPTCEGKGTIPQDSIRPGQQEAEA